MEQKETVQIDLLRSRAEAGDAEAQFNLGICYHRGKGVGQNLEEAVRWFRQAAEQGAAVAQFNLGVCYQNGKGVEQNDEEAVRWFRQAAEQGAAEAQNNLGNCYYSGKGIGRNNAEAARWHRLAAEQGLAAAQYNLGNCYYFGEGVEENYEEAAKWYRQAAEQGHVEAQNNLGVCYQDGKGIGQNDEEAVRWFRQAAEQGDAEAQFNLGVCYQDGKGVGQNNAEAVRWFLLAAEQGHPEAAVRMGNYCQERLDDKQAAKWYMQAAEAGNIEAEFLLGFFYKEGRGGLPVDWEHAEKCFLKGAETYMEAACEVYLCHRKRMELGQCADWGEDDCALRWLFASAHAGYAPAQYEAGVCYRDAGSPAEAQEYFRKAAEQGHPEAQRAVFDYCRGQAAAYAEEGKAKSAAGAVGERLKSLKKAAREKYPYAIALLADWYHRTGDDGQAVKVLKRGLKRDDTGICCALYGEFLEIDCGGLFPRDESLADRCDRKGEAAAWYARAVKLGYEPAMKQLLRCFIEGKCGEEATPERMAALDVHRNGNGDILIHYGDIDVIYYGVLPDF